MKCEKCGKTLEERPHRRINLCEKCYTKKRKKDVVKNMQNMRSRERALNPKMKTFYYSDKKVTNTQFQKIQEFGFPMIELNEKKQYLEFEGDIKFPFLPKTMFFRWSSKFYPKTNKTRLLFVNDCETETLPMFSHMDLLGWCDALKIYFDQQKASLSDNKNDLLIVRQE